MDRRVLVTGGGIALAAAFLGVASLGLERVAQAQGGQAVPAFEVDPRWPRMPENMVIGQVSGIAVDSRDHVWIIQRPQSVADPMNPRVVNPNAQCCTLAPPVMEFDAEGNYVQGWGGPGAGYEWPLDEHTIHVDHLDNVWISSAGGPHTAEGQENHILKFTRTGRFLLQIGRRGQSQGSLDTLNMNNAADIYVDPESNEVFVADGYNNRRVIVFDANTGRFRRFWGAYGERPDDSAPRDPVVDGPGPRQFNLVHGLRVSNDGLVYVADRRNNRVQVFTTDGTFQREVFIERGASGGLGTAFAVGFSPDPRQQYMYIVDATHGHVRIFDRQSLEEVGRIGRPGRYAGQFFGVHSVAVDSRGNVYTAEVLEGQRAQKFVIRAAR